MRISYCSSDVCSSDLEQGREPEGDAPPNRDGRCFIQDCGHLLPIRSDSGERIPSARGPCAAQKSRFGYFPIDPDAVRYPIRWGHRPAISTCARGFAALHRIRTASDDHVVRDQYIRNTPPPRLLMDDRVRWERLFPIIDRQSV